MGKSRMNNLGNKNSGIDRLWGFRWLGLQSSFAPNKSFLIREKSQHPNRQKGAKNNLDIKQKSNFRLWGHTYPLISCSAIGLFKAYPVSSPWTNFKIILSNSSPLCNWIIFYWWLRLFKKVSKKVLFAKVCHSVFKRQIAPYSPACLITIKFLVQRLIWRERNLEFGPNSYLFCF